MATDEDEPTDDMHGRLIVWLHHQHDGGTRSWPLVDEMSEFDMFPFRTEQDCSGGFSMFGSHRERWRTWRRKRAESKAASVHLAATDGVPTELKVPLQYR